MDPWLRPRQFLARGQACSSVSPTWRIKKILQATGRLLAESHLRFQVISKTLCPVTPALQHALLGRQCGAHLLTPYAGQVCPATERSAVPGSVASGT